MVLQEEPPAPVVTEPLGKLSTNFLPCQPKKKPDHQAERAAGPAFFLVGVRHLAMPPSATRGSQRPTSSVWGQPFAAPRPESPRLDRVRGSDAQPDAATEVIQVDLGCPEVTGRRIVSASCRGVNVSTVTLCKGMAIPDINTGQRVVSDRFLGQKRSVAL